MKSALPLHHGLQDSKGVSRFYLLAHEIAGIDDVAVHVLLLHQLLELLVVVGQRVSAEGVRVGNHHQLVGVYAGARRSAEERLVARVAPMTEARDAPLSRTMGGMVGSFMIQKMALTGASILSTRLGDHSLDLMARPLPLRISSVTQTILPSSSRVAEQFCTVSRYLLSSQPVGIV